MVANQPPERPGTPDFIVNKLRELEDQIAALSRQSKYPFVVSHGTGTPDFQIIPDPLDPDGNARVAIGNGAGGVVFETFYSTLYHGKVARFYDLSANLMWNQDELAGYGVSHPSLSLAMGPDFAGFGTSNVPNNTETSIGAGTGYWYNPAVWALSLVRPSAGTTWKYRYQVDYNGGTVYSALSANQTGAQYTTATVLLPASAMSKQISVTLLVTNTGGAQNFYFGHNMCSGVSAAQYYLNNGLPLP